MIFNAVPFFLLLASSNAAAVENRQIDSLINEATAGAASVFGAATNAGASIFGEVTEGWAKATHFGEQFGESVWQKATSVGGEQVTLLSDKAGHVITLADGVAGTVTSFAGAQFTAATGAVGDGWVKATQLGESVFERGTSFGGVAATVLTSIGGDAITIAEGAAGTVTNFAGSQFTAATGLVDPENKDNGALTSAVPMTGILTVFGGVLLGAWTVL